MLSCLCSLSFAQNLRTNKISFDLEQGSGVNIDTWTTQGSVLFISTQVADSFIQAGGTLGTDWSWSAVRQKIVTGDAAIRVCELKLKWWPYGSTYPLRISLKDSAYAAIVSSVVIPSAGMWSYSWQGINFETETLAANSTYYIYISSVAGVVYTGNNPCIAYGNLGKFSYETGTTLDGSGIWQGMGEPDNLLYILYSPDTGLYFSPVKQAATNWNGWGTFIEVSSCTTGNTMAYQAVTATSTYNLNTNPIFSIQNGDVIQSSTGPYIKIISSATYANTYNPPYINSIAVKYFNKYIRRKPMTDDN